ncbi:MAG: DUF2927 domain-containing protein [Pseudorhodobacter sp.]|nr:DUF2927 domain-containing protein [Pseudorhodobacter sp.]
MKLFVLSALTACAPTISADVAMRAHTPSTTEGLPAMKSFTAPRVSAPSRPNAEIAQDFLDLEFRMESGRILPVFTRFEGPITVALRGDVPGTAGPDLARVIQRLRTEAGIDLHQTSNDASITIEFVPRQQILTAYSNVACFVVPHVSSWAGYRAARGTAKLDWGTVMRRENVAIFVPSDTSPQEVRDCLHEELAQAMGPLNDLYQLSDSVFNDDNFHTVLTGFDMLILRLHYAPELRSGMSRAEVAARLPGLLARMNPQGQRPGGKAADNTPRPWITAIETALGAKASAKVRRAAAQQALAIARAQGWHDSRLAFSLFAIGRLNSGHDAATAAAAFSEAGRIYRSLPGGQIHAAHVDMQMAAFALSNGHATEALALADRAIPVVLAAENAALLATLMMVKAEALTALGRVAEARAVRLDSLGWARYGFGSQTAVRARMSEIAALVPGRQQG